MQTLLTVKPTYAKSRQRQFITGGLLLAAALMFSACASKPNSYYTLTAPADPPEMHVQTAHIFIELIAVAVPERLKRPQMVLTQIGANSADIVMLEQHRWISSFEHELRDGLTSGIVNSIGAIDVSKISRPPTTPVWRMTVQLRQFEAVENTHVSAAFSWSIRRAGAANSASCQWSGRETIGHGISALAQGAQRLTIQAARAMAHHLTLLASDQTTAICAP